MTSAGKSKGPLLIVLAVLAVALILIGRDTFSSQVTVKAQDGTDLVIHLDPADVTDWSGVHSGTGIDGTRKYGVSVKPAAELPEGNGNEVNLAGTNAKSR